MSANEMTNDLGKVPIFKLIGMMSLPQLWGTTASLLALLVLCAKGGIWYASLETKSMSDKIATLEAKARIDASASEFLTNYQRYMITNDEFLRNTLLNLPRSPHSGSEITTIDRMQAREILVTQLVSWYRAQLKRQADDPAPAALFRKGIQASDSRVYFMQDSKVIGVWPLPPEIKSEVVARMQ